MTDYSNIVRILLLNYMNYREGANNKKFSYKTRLMYDNFVAYRELRLIEIANEIISKNEKRYLANA